MRVTGLDHVVLCVEDTELSLAFYRDVLGLAPERYEEWKAGNAPFASVRIDEYTIIDLVERAPDGTNVDHFCLVVDDVDLDVLATDDALTVVEGPADRWGAQGIARALYVRDPDGNIVELRTYPG